MTSPSPSQIRAVRLKAGLSTAQSARLVHAWPRSWQKWESGERRMHPAFWSLYLLSLTTDVSLTGE